MLSFVVKFNGVIKLFFFFSIIDGIDCFVWVCCGDEFVVNLEVRFFNDIFFIVGRDGLVFYVFCNYDGEGVSMVDYILDNGG